MTDPIRTPAEALEAGAQEAEACDYPRSCPTTDEADCYDAMAHRISEAIRALASRIAAPDDEALVERCARAMQRENRPKHDCRNADQRAAEEDESLPAYKALARTALCEAGVLR